MLSLLGTISTQLIQVTSTTAVGGKKVRETKSNKVHLDEWFKLMQQNPFFHFNMQAPVERVSENVQFGKSSRQQDVSSRQQDGGSRQQGRPSKQKVNKVHCLCYLCFNSNNSGAVHCCWWGKS